MKGESKGKREQCAETRKMEHQRLVTGVESEESQSVEGINVNSGFTSPQEGTELRRCDDSTC